MKVPGPSTIPPLPFLTFSVTQSKEPSPPYLTGRGGGQQKVVGAAPSLLLSLAKQQLPYFSPFLPQKNT